MFHKTGAHYLNHVCVLCILYTYIINRCLSVCTWKIRFLVVLNVHLKGSSADETLRINEQQCLFPCNIREDEVLSTYFVL